MIVAGGPIDMKSICWKSPGPDSEGNPKMSRPVIVLPEVEEGNARFTPVTECFMVGFYYGAIGFVVFYFLLLRKFL